MAAPQAVEHSPYPARTRQASGVIDGRETIVSNTSFADRILITIRQSGRLAQWIQVPLTATRPTEQRSLFGDPEEEDAMLPLPHLTPRSLLGATDPERDQYGQLLSVQVASIISQRYPEESRLLLLGVGVEKSSLDNDALLDMLNLIGKSI